MKKLISMLLVFAFVFSITGITFADVPSELLEIKAEAPGETADTVVKVLGAMQWIGYAFAVGMLIYIGIKYTMAAANEKADLKKGVINYVIGAIVITSAVTICGWIVSFGQGLDSGGTNETPRQEESADIEDPAKPAIGG